MGFDLQKLPELNLKQFERIAPLCLMLLILALCWKLAGLFLALGGATTSHANATR